MENETGQPSTEQHPIMGYVYDLENKVREARAERDREIEERGEMFELYCNEFIQSTYKQVRIGYIISWLTGVIMGVGILYSIQWWFR